MMLPRVSEKVDPKRYGVNSTSSCTTHQGCGRVVRRLNVFPILQQLYEHLEHAMSITRPDFQEQLEKAVRSLVRRDSVIRDLKREHGLPTFRPHRDYFTTLVRSIVSQQISGSAARTIIERLKEAAGSLNDPQIFVDMPEDVLRGCGLSAQKMSYIRSLSEHVLDGRLTLRRLSRLSDEEIITALTDVKGIGVWTAKMFLMSSLGRLDVLPWEDLGVRNGIRIAYGLEENPSKAEIIAMADEKKWSPYRSVASWYMWRATD